MPPEHNQHGSFIDSAIVHVRAGRGGRGTVSFRREPYQPRGGPDGGDGGRGGSVILYATREESSLAAYLRQKQLHAPDGEAGHGGLKAGKSAVDLRLPVPLGTEVTDPATGAMLADLASDGAEAVVAAGGRGGRGNVHFKSSVNRSPMTAEPGQKGEERDLRLDLKLIADAGLVGAPNAGKSSLLRAISAATPKVGAYPFTTVDPELGVVQAPGGTRLVIADIPGLIEGAALGAGLGLRFLRHVERTRMLVYLVDGAAPDPWADFTMVRREIAHHSAELASRPALVAVNKVDLEETQQLRQRLRAVDLPPGVELTALHWISAHTGAGANQLVAQLASRLTTVPQPAPALPAEPVIRLRRRRSAPPPPAVVKEPWGYRIAGAALDRLIAATDFDSVSALQRFQLQLDRIGVSTALEEAGAVAGDTVRAGDLEFEYQP
ncbi:MAG: GTPase ObgE [Candidatus Dormibacteraeota bacterium]|nr:GTPase ObgE [Candidatus Dormibacteraeota bacterium]